jgi:hypothetical protein
MKLHEMAIAFKITAFKITSCTFIIRSSAAAEIGWLVSPASLQTAFQKRTDSVLITLDI